MKSIFLFFIIFFISFGSNSQTIKGDVPYYLSKLSNENMRSGFTSNDMHEYSNWRLYLLLCEETAIPFLMELLDDSKEYNRLIINSGETTYSNPPVIKEAKDLYRNIDWIAIRAGLLIQEISFQNFGFNNVTNVTKRTDTIKPEVDFEKLNLSILATINWWEVNKDNFNSLKGLTDALMSEDEKLQIKSLFYIEYNYYTIDGYSKKYYRKSLKNRIKNLTNSKNQEVKNKAIHILDMPFKNRLDNLINKGVRVLND